MQRNGNQANLDKNILIEVRDCKVGEQFTIDGKCVECQAGTTFSVKQMNSPGDCLPCPSDKAICNGGADVGPKPGFWRT